MLNIYNDMNITINKLNDLIKTRSFKNNIPLLLRANEDPLLVGTYKKNIIHDFCYMEWRCCEKLVPPKFKGLYHGVYQHDNYFDYDKRKNIYLSSLFALGFQTDDNIENKNVSQRIFEGLVYGCIVLSNSLLVCDQTNNIVIYVSTRDDIEEIMTYYINNPKLAEIKRNEGYEFCKQFRTNQLSAQIFVNLIQEKFDISI
jgi:hypothetical protein